MVVLDALEARCLLSAPTVEISATLPDAREAGDAAIVHLRRVGGNRNKPLGVRLVWSGSAKPKELGGDTDLVTFPARAKTLDLVISANNDGLIEAAETAKITIVPGKKYHAAKGKSVASIRVLDALRDDGTLKWTQVASAPVGRVEPETAVVGDKLFAFSGYTDSNWQPIRRVDRYDPATNQWTRMNDMPIGITHAAVAVVGTKVWFAGGYAERLGTTANQDIAITTVKIYDTVTDTWSDGPSLPQQRGSGGLGLVDNKLYFTSGEDRARQSHTETWMLDLNNTAAGWKSRAPIPQGKTHFGTVVIDGQMYVMGGQIGVDETATIVATAHRYDPKTNTWTRLKDLPIPMSHYSPATIARGGKVFLFGGEQHFTQESNQVLEYDPKTNTYQTRTPLPVTRAAAMAGVIGDQIVFSSGLDDWWHNDTYVGTFG